MTPRRCGLDWLHMNKGESMPTRSMAGALDGLKVLDLSSVMMGPMCAQQLGDMGADVIKVEAPEGDLTRGIGPRTSSDMGAVFMNYNRNKRSVVLNLKLPAAQQALARLAAGADVVVHSVRTEAANRIGLGYEALAKTNPALVYCHVKGFADDGAYGGKPAFDDIVQALSGVATLQAAVGGEPRYVPMALADKVCGIHAAYAIATALVHRFRTGRGQQVVLPMFETMAAFNTLEHLWGHVFEPPKGTMGYPSVRAGVRRPFATRDGHLAFVPYSDKDWRSFFEVAGRPELMESEAFRDAAGRQTHWQEVFRVLADMFRERTTQEWMAALAPHDIPMAVVNDLEALATDPHLQSVGFWQLMPHPTEGTLRLAANPIHLSDSPASIRRLAPRLGEHTREVLSEFDFARDEIERLLSEGAARQAA
ncbi:MAG: CoA transferase [Variovorax sp.]|nr:MAG: CoA transferase [Variovorax sp.]